MTPPVTSLGLEVSTRLLEAANMLLSPPRRVTAMALGGATLLARGIGLVLDAAAQEGEIQLTRASESIASAAFRWWG